MSEKNALWDLYALVCSTEAKAHRFAHLNSAKMRSLYEWSNFRESAEQQSRSYPGLRPLLGRICMQLDALQRIGDQGCMDPRLPGGVLFSAANPCHGIYQDLAAAVHNFKLAARLLDEYRQPNPS
jgi:hypothetical protein